MNSDYLWELICEMQGELDTTLRVNARGERKSTSPTFLRLEENLTRMRDILETREKTLNG